MRKEFFNNLAGMWDELETPDTRRKLADIVGGTAIERGSRVLDVGCGTGVLIPVLLRAVGETGEVIGIDFAGEMVSQAQAKGFGPNVRFLETDVLEMPFKPASFDAVFCNNVFPHFPDKPAVLDAIHRVLKPGGTLVICHTNSREGVNNRHREVGSAVAADLLPSVAEILEMLITAGFQTTAVIDGQDVFVIRATLP